MNDFLWGYLAGAALVAAWMAYVMQTELDRFDWQYDRGDIWFTFLITVLLWPFPLVLRPKALFGKKSLFNDGAISISDRARELHYLTESPPPCGKTIYYKHTYLGNEDTATEVWFEANELIKHFKNKKLPFKLESETDAFVAWIRNKDESLKQPTEVPRQINFDEIAQSLIEANIGMVKCKYCARCYAPSELKIHEPMELQPGWNTANHRCPEGHELLLRDHAHIQVRR